MNMARLKDSCKACPIRHSAVCAECDTDELAILEQVKSYRTYAPGESLASAGEKLDHLSSLVTGCATMSRTLEDGRRQAVGLLLPADFIGRPGRAISLYDIEAVSEVTLCRFERVQFERLVRETPHIAARLLTMTLDELDAAREMAVTLGRRTAREKIASFLVSMARRQTAVTKRAVPVSPVLLHLPLSRQAIADHLGLTIETVSRQLTQLRKSGLISVIDSRDITIPDFESLQLEAGDDDATDAP
ncbi:transcriptional regulator FnrL [Puniceibacterium confluentis]|uniref:transcriptional regulator FnrL n=1 Tax=Puniceibacterium confluentis TaxID=1958944 RepID=UPI0011B4A70B|nr:Crp/Fnr family transcriptional regulator [Puniceibacterium confluentis]